MQGAIRTVGDDEPLKTRNAWSVMFRSPVKETIPYRGRFNVLASSGAPRRADAQLRGPRVDRGDKQPPCFD